MCEKRTPRSSVSCRCEPPVVLDEELGLVETRQGPRVVVALGVGVEVPEQRVRPAEVGVERVGRVGVEVVGAGVARQRTGPPRALVEEAGLEVVLAAQVRQVHREVVGIVRRQPREILALADVDGPRVRQGVGAGERHVRQDVVRVVLRRSTAGGRAGDCDSRAHPSRTAPADTRPAPPSWSRR